MKMFRSLSVEPSSRFPIARWAPIPLRVVVGYGFLEHGIAKLSKGPHAFVAIVQAMGVPDPHFMAWLTILTELLGGFAVILGAFVAIVSLPMAIVLLVAMFKVHHPYGFSSVKLLAVTASGAKFGPPGYEVNLLYLACLAALVLGGSGPFALDRLISKRDDIPSTHCFERSSMTCSGGAVVRNHPCPRKMSMRTTIAFDVYGTLVNPHLCCFSMLQINVGMPALLK